MNAKEKVGIWQSFRQGPYYRPGIASFFMHVSLLIALSVNWLWNNSQPMHANQPVQIIQAQAINEQTFERAAQQQKAEQQQKIAEEKRKAEEIKQQEIAKQKAIAQEKRQAEAAAEQAVLEKQKAAEIIKQQKIAEQKKIAEEKRKVEEAAKAAEEKRKAEEAAKAAEEKRKTEEAAKQAEIEKQKAAEAQLKAEEERLRQEQMAAEQAALAAQQQQFVSNELGRFESLIQQKIASVWAVPLGADPSLQVRLSVRLAPDGTVLSANIMQSSGNSALDQSALTAVLRASPLPVSTDPAVFQEMRELDIILTPQSVL